MFPMFKNTKTKRTEKKSILTGRDDDDVLFGKACVIFTLISWKWTMLLFNTLWMMTIDFDSWLLQSIEHEKKFVSWKAKLS